jgi:DNA-binding NarL/FixJ family response regulator
MKTLRILLADDHEMLRKGLRAAIQDQPGWEVCGEATNGREAVDKAIALRPDVVVMDFGMKEMNGLEATRAIRAALPDTEVLMLTMHDSDKLVRDSLTAGARGYLLKTDAGELFISALVSLSRHEPFVTSKVAEVALRGLSLQEDSLPTGRESEILRLVAGGKSSREIAETLGISVKTAETHRSNLMRKLDLHSTADLVRYAIRNHIIQP